MILLLILFVRFQNNIQFMCVQINTYITPPAGYFRSSTTFLRGCQRWKAKDGHWQTSPPGWDELKGFLGWIGSISCQQVFQASAWTLNASNSALVLVFREVFTRPAEPEEGLKIDESSQNQFIAPELLACVMSGKIVLLFCLIEVHEAGTALKCLTIKVGFFILSFFFPSLPLSQIAFGLQESCV